MLGNYYGESKREPGPIDPVEPEIAEKVAMMQQQPTKEEVEEAITRIEYYRDAWVEDFNVLKTAYLALMEEVERDKINRGNRYRLIQRVADDRIEIEKLKADNQALQDSLVEQRRRMSKECDSLLDRIAGYQQAAMEEMKRLKEENQGLRAQIDALKWSIRNPPTTGGGSNFPPEVSTGTNIEALP